MQKLVYSFNEGSKHKKSLLGDKGANLSEMTKIGLRVPFGFIVTTEACNEYYAEGRKLSEDLITEIEDQIEVLENVAGKKFGDRENPLLVSVRSSAENSVPFGMDTVLNLGLNDETTAGLAELTENPRFAYDSYRRFIQMYGTMVLHISKAAFDVIFERILKESGADSDTELTAEDLQEVILAYQDLVKAYTDEPFPQDPKIQLLAAVEAIFAGWHSDCAILERKLNHIPDGQGTAVVIQAMVFGNMGEKSGAGKAFSRNPSNGIRELFGSFLENAQGEEFEEGRRTPRQIADMEELFPEAYQDFQRIANVLEQHYKDMQDMEFTIEQNKIYILQTRTAKRTAECAIRVAVDMVEEGLISKETAVARMDVTQIDQLLHPAFDHEAERKAKILAKGLPASPGAASGRIFFHAGDAVAAAQKGMKIILVQEETLQEDLAGITVADGILTLKGGMTSHAAVVARGMGKCCVAGCSDMVLDVEAKTLKFGDIVLEEGDSISLNGTMGHVYFGEVKNVSNAFFEEFQKIMSWADDIRTLKVRANADHTEEAKMALQFGAEGIGLCRTEHMFFEGECVALIRQVMLAKQEEERHLALDKLLAYQKDDFKNLYETMEDKPVTIRLMDPPLYEFLPQTEADVQALAADMEIPYEEMKCRIAELCESNPMLGLRGCRLAITYPEIIQMQTRAIMEAAIEVSREKSIVIVPEIMIPLVGIAQEFTGVKAAVVKTIEACKIEYEAEIDYFVGTMIEVPRAALIAGELAKDADFFSFGTNDLTQMTFGFSRDDTGHLIKSYVDKGILEEDPFQTIDQKGVGMLMEYAVKHGKQTRSNLKFGICGEHGGDPRSIEFCHRIGLHYVSCSAFRVPVARIAAAQAAIQNR